MSSLSAIRQAAENVKRAKQELHRACRLANDEGISQRRIYEMLGISYETFTKWVEEQRKLYPDDHEEAEWTPILGDETTIL